MPAINVDDAAMARANLRMKVEEARTLQDYALSLEREAGTLKRVLELVTRDCPPDEVTLSLSGASVRWSRVSDHQDDVVSAVSDELGVVEDLASTVRARLKESLTTVETLENRVERLEAERRSAALPDTNTTSIAMDGDEDE